MSDFHGRMMNIQPPSPSPTDAMWKIGHRDARHAAAEIALEADAEIERLTTLLHETQDRLAAARGAALVQGRNFDPAVRVAMGASVHLVILGTVHPPVMVTVGPAIIEQETA